MNLFVLLDAQAASQGSMLQTFLPFVLIIVVFYFFMIRPQMKRQKELRKFREALKKGDKIITTGGIYGVVSEVKDDAIVIEIADNVKVKVDKSAVVMDMADAVKR
ncbi:preprotein translocase subunit YajC [Breznakibacter xylanolyticus]|uniref:Sec translocon accessory complex subunit YajC n=1 Tax=Breznakibacter xylanolyticus TaxID=990 RepID=A0A2W7MTR7_9BACT|nr:preprotein translocase subunit YajC [Breznakibacter xylanolyticus]PZX10921.1 preprotein translocase subunit YajC [Breznakibacter xylanolyticus]